MDVAAPGVLTDKPTLERLAIAVMVQLTAEQLLYNRGLPGVEIQRGLDMLLGIATEQIAEAEKQTPGFARAYVRSAIAIRRPVVEAFVRVQPGYVPALVAAGLALEVTDTAVIV